MVAPLLLALALVSAPTSSKKTPWVALVHVRSDAPAAWADPLRSAAEQAVKDRAWVPPPAVSINDAALALGCSEWNAACAGQIASMTGANMALVVEVASAPGGGVAIIISSVKAGGAMQGASERLELPGRTAGDLKLAEEFVGAVAKSQGHKVGYLSVDTAEPKAEVWLDNEKVGETPWRGKVAPGEHELVLRQEGRAPLSRTVTIKAGAVTVESHSLTSAGPAVEVNPTVAPPTGPTGPTEPVKDKEIVTPVELPPPTAAEAPPTTTLGYTLAGVGGVLAAAGVVFLGATVYDLTNRIECGDPEGCVPNTPLLFGIYDKETRLDLFNHQTAWISGSLAALGVGGLLVATGVVLATGTPEEAPAR